MAGQEDEPQDVVLDVVDLGVEVGHSPPLPVGMLELRNLAAKDVCAPEVIDAAPLRGGHQPRRRVLRYAGSGPLLERGHERVLRKILGELHVTGHPGEGADEAGRLGPPSGDDGLVRIIRTGLCRHQASVGARASPRLSRRRRGASGPVGDLAQGGDHGDLGPVLRVQLGELLLVGDGLLEAVVLHDGPAADDLLGLGVRPVDAADLALADDEVHGVLSAVQPAAVEEHALGGLLADVVVHRVEQRLRRRADALFHPHESHETRHLDHSYSLLEPACHLYVERPPRSSTSTLHFFQTRLPCRVATPIERSPPDPSSDGGVAHPPFTPRGCDAGAEPAAGGMLSMLQ